MKAGKSARGGTFASLALGLVLASGAGASTYEPASVSQSSSVAVSTAVAVRTEGPSAAIDFNSVLRSWAQTLAIPFDTFRRGISVLFK